MEGEVNSGAHLLLSPEFPQLLRAPKASQPSLFSIFLLFVVQKLFIQSPVCCVFVVVFCFARVIVLYLCVYLSLLRGGG